MVLLTVRSLASCFRTLSYSAMAFCSLPCWTNFSAALRTFCLLKPKPNAIGYADSSLFPAERLRFPPALPSGSEPRRELPRRNTANRATGIAEQGYCKARYPQSDGYRRLPEVTEGECTSGFPEKPSASTMCPTIRRTPRCPDGVASPA